MSESEDTTSGKTVDQNETISESSKVKTRTSAVRGGRGEIRKSRNNTRYSLASTSKDYKGVIEAFEAVLAMKYEKV